MSQNLQTFAEFQKCQLDNLVDFEKCCKTRIFLQKSVPIQPKTSNILPKFCQKLATTLRVRRAGTDAPSSRSPQALRQGHLIVKKICASMAMVAMPDAFKQPEHSVLVTFEDSFLRLCWHNSKIAKLPFSKTFSLQNLQIFGELVLGCIKTKVYKKICV